MDEYFRLIDKYIKANPEAENPENYAVYLSLEEHIQMLKKALKENLLFTCIEGDENTLDGGEVTLIKKP